MAEQRKWYERQYPNAEFRKRARTTTEVLEEELGFYPDGPSFRGGLIGIGRIYEQTKLMQSFIRYARLTAIAAVVTSDHIELTEDAKVPGIDSDFMAGETFGIHCLLKPAPFFVRRNLLKQDLFENIANSRDNTLLRQATEELAEYRNQGWQELLDLQDTEHQELLIDAAIRAYDDIPNARNAEEGFLAGYLYAGNLIVYRGTRP